MIVGGVLVAMSGGVDSSVAALLLVGQGYSCIGGMMKLFSNDDKDEGKDDSGSWGDGGGKGDNGSDGDGGGKENLYRLSADAEDARAVAARLGIQFYVFDFSDVFKERVIQRFIQVYQNGGTPNPCIDCNRHLKFRSLIDRARELDKEYIATGHYARIEKDVGSGRLLLKKGADLSKDQSYVLYTMTQEQLKATLFPLGGMTKSQVREIALERGFLNADKHDSQDICFAQNDAYPDFIRRHADTGVAKGRFIDIYGNDLGENKGIIHYTVGQRKGLGLSAAAPLYVCEVRAEDNTVVVGTQENLFAKTLIAKDINLIATDRIDSTISARARIRYKQPEQIATVRQLDEDTLRIDFEEPQRAITKGQAVVLYDGDTVIGGGTIDRTTE